MSHSAPFIAARNLTHSFDKWGYKVTALQNLNLEIGAGEWVTLIGPNGSGKSTFLQLLSGRLGIQSGSIDIAGRNIAGLSARELSALVFLVRQDPLAGTAPTLSVYEHLVAADKSFASVPRSERRKRYAAELEKFGLDVGMDQLVSDLSGGQRQLLTVLLSRFRSSPVILLDEPLAALDPKRAVMCRSAIEELHREGKTIVLVTHDLHLVRALGHRTVELKSGFVEFDGGTWSESGPGVSSNSKFQHAGSGPL